MKKNWLKPTVMHTAAFLVPALALAAVFVAIGIYPAGDKSSLALDMRSQYISFFSYLKNQVWLGVADYRYTFGMALGGNMMGLAAYYLASPFNLLLLLFPTHNLPVAVTLITLCKVGCCGLTMSLYLNRRGARLASLAFAVPYALTDFVIAFQHNIMWLDGVLLLPVVVLGIERILDRKSPLCYVLALGGAIIANYYIGFMLCVFSVVYFAAAALGFHGLPLKAALRPAGRFAGASVLAGGLSAFVLLPGLMAMQGGKAGLSFDGLFAKSFATMADVVSRYLPGTANVGQIFFGYPAIYTGMLAILCAVLYFTGDSKPLRAKIAAFVLLALPLFSFVVGPVDRFWHGLNKPVGFLFRYSFLFAFTLLAVGWQGLLQLKRHPSLKKHLPMAVVLLAVAAWLAQRAGRDYVTTGKLLLGAGLLVVAAVLLWLRARGKLRYSFMVLAAFVLVDMGASMYLSMRWMDYLPMADYQNFVLENQPVVDAVNQQDDSFFRMEKTYAFSDNDAMLLGYNGLSHYSSVDKMAIRGFLEQLGFSDGGYSVKYVDGSTISMDNLLGIKYLLVAGNMPKPYTALFNQNGRQVWQNPNALPLGIVAGAEVLEPLPETANLFAVQNHMWRAIAPQLGRDIYRPAAAECTLNGVGAREIEEETLFEKQQDGGFVEYTLTTDSDDMLYALFTTQNYRGARLYINGDLYDNFLTNDRHGIMPLGRFEKGTAVHIQLEPIGGELFVDEALFYYEDNQSLQEISLQLAENGYQPEQHTSSFFIGDMPDTNGDWMLLSLPYDKGWQATALVGGQPDSQRQILEMRPAFGALTAVKLPAGSGQLQLRYMPPGTWMGLWLSAFSLLVLALWQWWIWRGRQKRMSSIAAALGNENTAAGQQAYPKNSTDIPVDDTADRSPSGVMQDEPYQHEGDRPVLEEANQIVQKCGEIPVGIIPGRRADAFTCGGQYNFTDSASVLMEKDEAAPDDNKDISEAGFATNKPAG